MKSVMAFFRYFITNILFNSSVLPELLTSEKVTKVTTVLSAFVHVLRFLMGMALYMKASSMTSKMVETFILFTQCRI